jgi:hypothetical protein
LIKTLKKKLNKKEIKMYIVETMCGNFSHIIGKFEEEWEAVDFLQSKILEDTQEMLKEDPEYSWEEAEELAGSYYALYNEDDL